MNQLLLDVLTNIGASCGTIILILIGSLILYGLKLLCKKMGIAIKDTDYDAILAIVKQVIRYFDQTYVDSIKKANGSLTKEQQKDIKEKALNMVKELLTTEQVQYLLKKYELDDIDKIIDVLIESSISEVRKEEKIN